MIVHPDGTARLQALTLHEPWATLIANGTKTAETRGWAAPRNLVGAHMVVHAGKQVSRSAQRMLHAGEVKPGHALAIVRLKACVQVAWYEYDIHQREYAVCERGFFWQEAFGTKREELATQSTPYRVVTDHYGDFTRGRWLWVFDQVRKLDPPIPMAGHQGLWWAELPYVVEVQTP